MPPQGSMGGPQRNRVFRPRPQQPMEDLYHQQQNQMRNDSDGYRRNNNYDGRMPPMNDAGYYGRGPRQSGPRRGNGGNGGFGGASTGAFNNGGGAPRRFQPRNNNYRPPKNYDRPPSDVSQSFLIFILSQFSCIHFFCPPVYDLD